MIRSSDIQNAYVELYKTLRVYIWDYMIVCAIADLEIACFETCPNIPNIKQLLRELKVKIPNTLSKDEDMQAAFDEFEELLNDSNDTYCVILNRVEETKDYEDFEE